jgi:hypothetical protein
VNVLQTNSYLLAIALTAVISVLNARTNKFVISVNPLMFYLMANANAQLVHSIQAQFVSNVELDAMTAIMPHTVLTAIQVSHISK